MKLNSKWRRYLCSSRWLRKLTPQLFKCHNVQLLVAAKQQKAFVYGAGFGVVALLAVVAIMSSARAQAVIQPAKPAPVEQVSDSDRGAKSKLPVAYSDDTVTITFHNCRENAKQHWSCQRTDGDDTDHYVYIPGFKPAHTRPGIGSADEEKGGK